MKTTVYLSIDEILNLQKRTIDKHGGKPGVRDMGLLESATLRCQSGYYNSLSEQAASLLQSLCMNHCFYDGNKRAALLSAIVFLKMNNYNLKVENQEIVHFIVNSIIIKKSGITEIAQWIESKMSKN